MKMTIGEVIEKVDKINDNIDALMAYVNKKCNDHLEDTLENAVELLQEYRDMICSTKVEI